MDVPVVTPNTNKNIDTFSLFEVYYGCGFSFLYLQATLYLCSYCVFLFM